MAIFKVPRTILVARAAFKMYSMLDVSETPCTVGYLPVVPQVGHRGRAPWRPGKLAGTRGDALSLPVQLSAPGSSSRLATRGVELFLTYTQQKRACRRTREAVSSDPPAVRSPAESGGCPDGTATSSRSPAPCSIRLREGGGEAATARVGVRGTVECGWGGIRSR